MKPIPAKPRMSIAHVLGSGTADPRNKSVPAELDEKLLPNAPDIVPEVALSGIKKVPTVSVS